MFDQAVQCLEELDELNDFLIELGGKHVAFGSAKMHFEVRNHQGNNEPLLGVIREQGEWPLRQKGAKSMALSKEGSREQGKRNLGAGSRKIWKGEQGAAKKLGNGAWSKRNYQGARVKITLAL